MPNVSLPGRFTVNGGTRPSSRPGEVSVSRISTSSARTGTCHCSFSLIARDADGHGHTIPLRRRTCLLGMRLTYNHIGRMVIHMKTTLNIDDTVMAQLRREAARQGRTMSELVESALRLLFTARRQQPLDLPPLPSFRSGGHLVNIDDREALYHAMEGR